MICSALKPCTITHELVSWGILSIYDYYKLLLLNTSIPVEASMSRKTSTKFLTSLAALAFDTVLRNGLINLISPPSSKKQNYTHNQSIVASVTASRVHPSCLNKHSSTTIKKKNDWQTNELTLPSTVHLVNIFALNNGFCSLTQSWTFTSWMTTSPQWPVHTLTHEPPLTTPFPPLHNGHFLPSPRSPLWKGSTVLEFC